ncbi:MAG: type II secretion system F family protein [Planctomycetes bacterium]|nr:type II secretion system F family protein [Planctomycetota bacterium]
MNPDLYVYLAMASAFGAALCFGYVGIVLFGHGWVSYEERYVKGAARTLESMYLTIPVQNLIYLSVLSFLLVMLLVGFLSGNFLVGTCFGLVAFSVPKIALVFMKSRRDKMFNLQLIDALNSCSNSLKAGLTLNQAFDQIQEEMENPISQEFRMLNQQLRLGVSLEDGLHDMLRRMPGQDMELVVTATIIARDIGGNLPEVFSNIAETIRQRHSIEGKIRALTAQGKAQAVVICLLPIFIGVGLNLVSPDLMRPMFETVYGWAIIAVIFVMELIGALIIRKIVTIDV